MNQQTVRAPRVAEESYWLQFLFVYLTAANACSKFAVVPFECEARLTPCVVAVLTCFVRKKRLPRDGVAGRNSAKHGTKRGLFADDKGFPVWVNHVSMYCCHTWCHSSVALQCSVRAKFQYLSSLAKTFVFFCRKDMYACNTQHTIRL